MRSITGCSADPFAGWTEIVKPFDPGVPSIGPGPLGIIRLTIRRHARPAKEAIGL
jgi:hypothetical protein